MKRFSREIVVGILACIALFLLYFGWNFLKGVNIFTNTNTYVGQFSNINGLTEQAPVYVRGYKVGQVDKIQYDFTREQGFTILLSARKDIILPSGTELALVSDGLLGGQALELIIPAGLTEAAYNNGDTLPSHIVPGLVETLQDGLLTDLASVVERADSLLAQVNSQLEGDHIKRSLEKVDNITSDLNQSSNKLKQVMQNDLPQVVADAKVAVADVRQLADNAKDIDLKATVDKVDKAVSEVDEIVAAVNSTDGTIGMLLNDKALYLSLNETMSDVDSLLIDLKANPKRYVHFSLFGRKDKDKK